MSTAKASVTPEPAVDPVIPVALPTWTDAASVTSYLTSVVAAVVGILTLVHPGFHEPTDAQSILPALGFVIAGGAQVVNIIMHRSVQKAAILRGRS